jgi:predicted CoA-binding protein
MITRVTLTFFGKLMTDLISLLKHPDTTIAIVGATDNPAKFGNIIYKDLKRKGFRLFPVNPNKKMVEHDSVYPSLSEIPEKPTIVDFVVPPEVTLKMLKQCLDLGLMNVWLQPGTTAPAVMDFLQQNRFNYLTACIMVESRFTSK